MISREFVRKKLADLGPGYLKRYYRQKWTPERPTTGYCYLVSEALYHYAFTDLASFVINLGPELGTHWFLKDSKGKVIDYTGDQFDFPVPYEKARRAIFFKGAIETPRGYISRNGFLMAKYLKLI